LATIRWIALSATRGGECELQDMTFSYGAAESKFAEAKNHADDSNGPLVVYFDRPRCNSVLSLRARSAARGWMSGRSAYKIAPSVRLSPQIKRIILIAKSAACASTFARSAR